MLLPELAILNSPKLKRGAAFALVPEIGSKNKPMPDADVTAIRAPGRLTMLAVLAV
jgi:hypothetical protein